MNRKRRPKSCLFLSREVMKALILTVTAGQGHNAAAKAMAQLLEERGVQTEILDLYRGRRPFWAWVFNEGYFLGLKVSMPLANWIYRKGMYRNYAKRESNSLMRLARMDRDYLAEQLRRFEPDLIISTHVLPAAMIDLLKDEIPARVVTCGMVTDYCIHPYWECAIRNDFCIIPAEEMIPGMEKHGWKREQLAVYPVPVRKAFYRTVEKEGVKQSLGLEKSPVLLIMGGGEGACDSVRIIKNLLRLKTDFQIVNICGKNRKMKEKVDRLLSRKLPSRRVINLGFVENVEDWMAASDLYLGKVGMITSTEAICRNLPMLAVRGLAQQEIENALYLSANGGLSRCERGRDYPQLVEEIFSHPEILERMRESQKKLNRPEQREQLGNFLISEAEGKTNAKT